MQYVRPSDIWLVLTTAVAILWRACDALYCRVCDNNTSDGIRHVDPGFSSVRITYSPRPYCMNFVDIKCRLENEDICITHITHRDRNNWLITKGCGTRSFYPAKMRSDNCESGQTTHTHTELKHSGRAVQHVQYRDFMLCICYGNRCNGAASLLQTNNFRMIMIFILAVSTTCLLTFCVQCNVWNL